MKIERFSQYIKESLSKSLEEYCYELFDVGYKVDPHGFGSHISPWDPKSDDFFILSGQGHAEDVQKFIDIIESMEPIRAVSSSNSQGLTIILCISEKYYIELSRRFDLYFKYVSMEIRKGKKYFYYNNNKNRVDSYDGVEIRSGDCYIAYETTSNREKVLMCNQNDFWNTLANKIRTRSYDFISCFLKLLLLDNFEVKIPRPVARFSPHLKDDVTAGWQLRENIMKKWSESDLAVRLSKEKAKKKN